jgi:hypothetical protein
MFASCQTFSNEPVTLIAASTNKEERRMASTAPLPYRSHVVDQICDAQCYEHEDRQYVHSLFKRYASGDATRAERPAASQEIGEWICYEICRNRNIAFLLPLAGGSAVPASPKADDVTLSIGELMEMAISAEARSAARRNSFGIGLAGCFATTPA